MDVTFDATISSNSSTSYLSIEEAKQILFDRGYDYGTLTDTDLKRYLNKATSYIDSEFSPMFNGYRTEDNQSLSWPREGAFYIIDPYEISSTIIPPEIKNATIETVKLLIDGEDITATISKSGKVKTTRVKVDVIEEESSFEESLYSDIYVAVNHALSRITGGAVANNILKIYRVGGDSG